MDLQLVANSNRSLLFATEREYSAAGTTQAKHSIAFSDWLAFRPVNPVQLNLSVLSW